MDIVTIKRTGKGVWMKRFDGYEPSFKRISIAEAVESINMARMNGEILMDDDMDKDCFLMFAYKN